MPDLTLHAQLAYAQELIEGGDPVRAISVCRRILGTFPRCIQAYALMGQALLRQDDLNGAAQLFARVLSADPEHTATLLGLAALNEARGDHQAAMVWWLRSNEVGLSDGTSPPALWLAERTATTSAEEPAELSSAGLARTLLHAQLFDRAAAAFETALAASPERADLATGAIEARWRLGDLDGAARASERLLQRLPFCLKALLVQGKAELNSSEDARARHALTRAQSLDPDNRLAQQLFGSESPLPLRTARLAPQNEEALPLLLPYLAGAEEDDESEGDWPIDLDSIL